MKTFLELFGSKKDKSKNTQKTKKSEEDVQKNKRKNKVQSTKKEEKIDNTNIWIRKILIGSVGNGDILTPNFKKILLNTLIEIPKEAIFAFDSRKYNQYADTFEFEVAILEDNQTIELICRRTDAKHGWGQNLVVEMIIFTKESKFNIKKTRFEYPKKLSSSKGKTNGKNGLNPATENNQNPNKVFLWTRKILIGSVGNGDPTTKNNKKTLLNTLIEIPKDVMFGFDSKKYNPYEDTFEFEVTLLADNQTIEILCRRTDANHGWGQNLYVEMVIFNKESKFDMKKTDFSPPKKISFKHADNSNENEENKRAGNELNEKNKRAENELNEDNFEGFWKKGKKLGLHKFSEYSSIEKKMMIRLDILQKSRMESILKTIDSALPNYVLQTTVNQLTKSLGGFRFDIINTLGSSFGNEPWRHEYLIKSIYVQMTIGQNSVETAFQIVNYIQENVDLCSSRRIECWFAIVEGAASLIVTHNKQDSITDEKEKLQEFLIQYIHELRQEAFNKTFLNPTKEYYDRTHQTVRSFDTYIHGYNVYACLLLATLGIQLDKPIVFDDEAKSIVDFLRIPQFSQEVINCFWKKNKWMNNGSQKSLQYCYNDNSFIFSGYSPLEIARNSISDYSTNEQRLKYCEYLDAFAQNFSQDKMLLKLANKLLERDILSLIVLNSYLKENNKEHKPISKMNEFIWNISEDGSEVVMNEKDLIEFLSYLKIFP